LARRSDSTQPLGDIAAMARSLVQDMSDIVWAVNPRHDGFEALVRRMRHFASETLTETDLHFHTGDLPRQFELNMGARRTLYLVFKEVVHNAAKHSGARTISIRLAIESSALRLTVTDDGRGFDPSATADGEGLPSVRKRMSELGGSAEWETAPGQGTRFVGVLPLAHVSFPSKLRGFWQWLASKMRER